MQKVKVFMLGSSGHNFKSGYYEMPCYKAFSMYGHEFVAHKTALVNDAGSGIKAADRWVVSEATLGCRACVPKPTKKAAIAYAKERVAAIGLKKLLYAYHHAQRVQDREVR